MRGQRQIGTLRVGDPVVACNPSTGKAETQPIQHVWINHDAGLVDVHLTTQTANGADSETIHTTANHPWLTADRSWVQAGDLKPGEAAGADARAANPFVGPESDLVIVSVDTLAAERTFGCLQDPSVAPYDLVVFDEAHKLTADPQADPSLRKTDRYRLAEALAGLASDDPRWQLPCSAQHLLLLTATPHLGKDFRYYWLWWLL